VPAADSPAPRLGHVRRAGVAYNTPEWAEIVSRCYGFRDCTVRTGSASLPLFHSRSPLFGSKLVSAVFNSYASPIFESDADCDRIVGDAIAAARSLGVRLFEVKSLFPLPQAVVEENGLVERRRFRTTLVDLTAHRPELASYTGKFRRHLRSAYDRARRAGVRIERTDSLADMIAFHEVMLRHYRDRHSMIGQPRRLFELIHSLLVRAGKGDLWVARTADGRVVGGIVALTTPTVVTAAFGSSSVAFRSMSIDAVLKDTTLNHYAAAGFPLYDFGVSSPKQPALEFAKSRFGGCSFDVPYYYRAFAGGRIPDIDFTDAFVGLRRYFKLTPMPIVRRLSPLIVSYLN
jgi:hypothetical protein